MVLSNVVPYRGRLKVYSQGRRQEARGGKGGSRLLVCSGVCRAAAVGVTEREWHACRGHLPALLQGLGQVGSQQSVELAQHGSERLQVGCVQGPVGAHAQYVEDVVHHTAAQYLPSPLINADCLVHALLHEKLLLQPHTVQAYSTQQLM